MNLFLKQKFIKFKKSVENKMNRKLNIFEPKRYYKSYKSDKYFIHTDVEIDDEIEIRLIFNNEYSLLSIQNMNNSKYL